MSGHHHATASLLLTDIPSPAFQAIVDRLEACDVARLRLVSTAVCVKATSATRRIVLRLSGPTTSSSTNPSTQHSSTAPATSQHPSTDAELAALQQQQLRAWRAATRCFDHATEVHICVAGKLSAQQWGAAVRALAYRGNVRSLRITPASYTTRAGRGDGSRCCAATIPSLLPVRQHLLPSLHSLAVEAGVAVTDLSADTAAAFLAPPEPGAPAAASSVASASASVAPTGEAAAAAAAAAAGFRALRHLELSCAWSPSGSLTSPTAFIAAMAQLPRSFPALQHLTLQLPAVAAPALPHIAPNPAVQAAAGGVAAALAAAAAARATAAAAAVVHRAQAQASMLAAAVAAAAALPKLQHLDLAHIPDIWAVGPGPAAINLAHAAAAAAAGGGVPATAFRSLDDLGSWLLLQLPALTHLAIIPAGATCSMSWSRTAAATAAAATPSSSSAVSTAPAPTAVKLVFHAGMQRPAPAANSTNSSSEGPQALLQELTAHLGRYSRRAAGELLPRITSLQAALHPEELHSTAAALAAMPALTHLKLTVLATSSKPTDFAALVAAAAAPLATAAAAGSRAKLQSLTLLPGLGQVEVTAASLLPLTAMAAATAGSSSGSSLRELKLVGNFHTVPCSTSSSSSSGGLGGSPWAALRAVEGLEVFRVHQVGAGVLELPMDCLPAGLRVLEAKRVHLLPPAAAAAEGPGSSSGSSPSSSDGAAAAVLPALQSLCLQDCRLDEVSGLAGSSLQDLVIAATQMPGGWAAAVTAWPRLRALTVWSPAAKPGNSTTTSSSSSSSSRTKKRRGSKGAEQAGARAGAGSPEDAAVQLLQELAWFGCLEALELQHLRCLSPGVLHLALHHMPRLSHLAVSAAGVSQQLARAVPVGGGCSSASSSSSAVKYVSLRLPVAVQRAAGAAVAGTHAAAAAGASAGGSGAAPTCSTVSTNGRSAAAVVQQGLLEALPWCGVSVAADMCWGYVQDKQ